MLWEWLVMPQGLSNAPATFNRLVTDKLRHLRDFAPSYFDDIYVHSRASRDVSDVEVHRGHLRALFQVLRENGLYANLQKCMFGVDEIPVLGDFVGINGCRVDPAKVEAVTTWPTPQTVSELRSWLGLATYLHKFSKNFASIARPLSALLAKDVPWAWTDECQSAFDGIKTSLIEAPVLALPDFSRPFSVVCDASIQGIGCCLMQEDASGMNRPVSYQSRQMRAAERNYPVHNLELLAVKHALVKFRIYLLGSKPFVVYTDHASLKYAVKSPHISERMARWLAFFAEFNMTVECKPGRENVLADALSRRPMTEDSSSVDLNRLTQVHSDLSDRIRRAYRMDPSLRPIVANFRSPRPDATLYERYSMRNGILYFQPVTSTSPRMVVPCDVQLRTDLVSEHHDTPSGGHFGRDKTYVTLARQFWWPRMYKTVARYVASCSICQKVKSSPSIRAPAQMLQVPEDVWSSVSMDYIFGLPRDGRGNTGIWTCVDRASKFLVAIPVKDSITAEQSAKLFFDAIYCRFGLPSSIVSDRDPRFTSKFWIALFSLVSTKLNMSTSDHPESDGQTERANRVIEDVLRCFAQSRQKTWSSLLPHVEFAYNTATNVTTSFSPFYVNFLRHPRLPSSIDDAILSGGGYWAASTHSAGWVPNTHEDDPPARTIASVEHFVKNRESIILQVQDNIALAQERQAKYANQQGRQNKNAFQIGDEVLLHRSVVPKAVLGNTKLQLQWWGQYPITKVISRTSFRLALPAEWNIHNVFYVGKLKPYIPRDSEAAQPERSVKTSVNKLRETIRTAQQTLDHRSKLEQLLHTGRHRIHD
ncbi:hypothetical protein Ae201684_018948 [Aphanomyces euteiches]|uniref:Integrase catalytic domain-containing protein n=1 Tax=Aphanomyces euteiches TaxID=100861 RepID=A0A6G0W401_9STRA|nr:hypothetical protein Ae201684_018948 [Aphanomyces euteiches]